MSATLAAPEERDLSTALHSSDGFQLLVRTLPDAVLAVDAQGIVRYASDQSENFLGWRPRAMVGRPLLELFHPDDRSVFPRDIARGALGAWDVRSAADPEMWLSVAVLVPDAPGHSSELRQALEGSTLFLVRDVPLGDDLLRDRTDLLRRALDSADNVIVVSDPQAEDNPLVFVNQHYLDVTGYTREEVIGKNCRFLQRRADGTWDDDQEGLDELRRALAAGESTHVILRNYRKNGELFYNELFITPIRSATGEVVNYVGVQNDVTERVLAQRDAASQSSLLQAFYDSAPILMGVVQRDQAGVLHRTANARASAMFGTTSGEVAGARTRELGFSESETERWDGAIEACAESGEPVSFETTHPWDSSPDDKACRMLRITVSRVHQSAEFKQEQLFSYIGEDVTDQRRAAAQIRTLAAAVEGTSEAILITDASPDPAIIYANPAHEALTGYPNDEVVGQSPRMFQGPESERAVLDRIGRRLGEGRVVAAETVNYRKDGSTYTLQWEISPVLDEAGTVTKWVSLQRDVTDQRRLEHEVLEAAGREQEWMARELHDGLGQVLTGSGIQLHVLQQHLLAQGDAGLAADAERIGGHISDALSQARTISRGLFPVAIEPGELAPALEHLSTEAGETLGLDVSFEARGSFEVESTERAGHVYRIAQEALTNAARHGEAQKAWVTLVQDGSEATLSVRDDGSGITDRALESSDGLGLRTMAYRARRVGGLLDVRRHDTGGTEVRARFPLASAEVGEGREKG